ncbi:hypothetical protein LJR038_005042 [Acidovorax sp. LjRoot38]|uniref:hypothetical protein n=1 Tax=Acidovorax sp. LjRoot38 TaxID=3342327 RepID=UPI003ECD7801
MTEQSGDLKRLEAEIAELKRGLRQLSLQFAVDHHLVVALALQCNSPEILRSNFNEIANKSKDRLLNSTLTDDDIDALDRFQKLVDKQLPSTPAP